MNIIYYKPRKGSEEFIYKRELSKILGRLKRGNISYNEYEIEKVKLKIKRVEKIIEGLKNE